MHSSEAKDSKVEIVCVGKRELRQFFPSRSQSTCLMVQVVCFSLARFLSLSE